MRLSWDWETRKECLLESLVSRSSVLGVNGIVNSRKIFLGSWKIDLTEACSCFLYVKVYEKGRVVSW